MVSATLVDNSFTRTGCAGREIDDGRLQSPRRFATRGGERALRLRSPFWFQIFTLRSQAFRNHSQAAPRRHLRSCLALSLGPVSPASVTDSTVCRLSIRCRTPLHRFRGMLSLIPKSSNHSRPSKFQRTPPDVNSEWAGGAATLVASLLARLIRFPQLFHQW